MEVWEEIYLSAGQWSQTQGQSNTGVAQEEKINVLQWPSPDLSPIGNLWHYLKIAVHKQRHSTNLNNLETNLPWRMGQNQFISVCKAGTYYVPQTVKVA